MQAFFYQWIATERIAPARQVGTPACRHDYQTASKRSDGHNTLAVALALGRTGGALAEDASEDRDLAELVLARVDTAVRGNIDMGEFSDFGTAVLVSMDSEASGKIMPDAFIN